MAQNAEYDPRQLGGNGVIERRHEERQQHRHRERKRHEKAHASPMHHGRDDENDERSDCQRSTQTSRYGVGNGFSKRNVLEMHGAIGTALGRALQLRRNPHWDMRRIRFRTWIWKLWNAHRNTVSHRFTVKWHTVSRERCATFPLTIRTRGDRGTCDTRTRGK